MPRPAGLSTDLVFPGLSEAGYSFGMAMCGGKLITKRIPAVVIALAVTGGLPSCSSGGKQFEIGTVEYYTVAPSIPSHVATQEEAKKYLFEPYVAVWGMLGTTNESGPKLIPKKVVLGGQEYAISNVRTNNKDYKLYYLFEIRDQNPVEGLPWDPGTGNLFQTEPARRNRLPVRVLFRGPEDGLDWTGAGQIEQSTILRLQSMEKEIEVRG